MEKNRRKSRPRIAFVLSSGRRDEEKRKRSKKNKENKQPLDGSLTKRSTHRKAIDGTPLHRTQKKGRNGKHCLLRKKICEK